MHYHEFLEEIKLYAKEEYKCFHKKLLKDEKIEVLGVKVPDLRKLAKKYGGDIEWLLSLPDEYYEVTFIKLVAVASLDYPQFIKYVDRCVPLIDNWASCDSAFDAKCIAKHREEFLPFVRKYIATNGEFYQRYALVTLLKYYAEDSYTEVIFPLVEKCDTSKFYVHMAAAWLISEMLVKCYPQTSSFLLENSLDKKTHNKAIQKACESFRISNDRKNYLKGIKR